MVQRGFEADVLDEFAVGDSLSVIIILDSGETATFVLEMDGLADARTYAADLAGE